jgi:hypothetical protein
MGAGSCNGVILEQIRDCFTSAESDEARTSVKTIIDGLGLSFLCDQIAPEPYLRVALLLRQVLNGKRGNSPSQKSDWTRAVQLASIYASGSYVGLPASEQWRSDVRVSTLSEAIRELRSRGYAIYLLPNGDIEIPESDSGKLVEDIERLAQSLGCAVASSAAQSMGKHLSSITGRFNIGRTGHTVDIDAKPQVPLAYLYQLGLRYSSNATTVSNPEAAYADLVCLVTCATTLLDTYIGVFEQLHLRACDFMATLQKSLVYDSVFLVAQAKPAHAREFIEWMLSQEALSNLRDSDGRTSASVLAVALMLLTKCERGNQYDFIAIRAEDAAYASGLDLRPANDLLLDVFSHQAGANQKLTYPPRDNDVDAAFRPLVPTHQGIALQPSPLAARAVVNATLDWCRSNGKASNFDEKVVGPLFERFVREALRKRNVDVFEGKYQFGSAQGQCDAVVVCDKSVVFFELKSKLVSRAARSGDDVKALVDLSQALVKPQKQAMERHAFLLENGVMTLSSDDGNSSTVTKGDREVLKLSVTRGELNSLHDRPFLQHFFRVGCTSKFSTTDPKQQKSLEDLNNLFAKFNIAAKRAGEGDLNARFPFARCWSLSVFQLLTILERTTDNDSFDRELQRTRRMMTPRRDFYAEYEWKLSIDGRSGSKKLNSLTSGIAS